MTELSLNILDIAINSVKAKSKHIEISISEDIKHDLLSISVSDDGMGMSPDKLEAVRRRSLDECGNEHEGLGIPMLRHAAEIAGGTIEINSVLGMGTAVNADFEYKSRHRASIGSMSDTIVALISAAPPDTEIVYRHSACGSEFVFDTKVMRGILKDISIAEPEVLMWIGSYIKDGLSQAGISDIN